jgi:subtilisin family serine protease
VPNDPYYLDGRLWGMYGSNTVPNSNPFGNAAGAAWQAGSTGSRNICVGVVDTGIQIGHPDLAPNIWTNPWEIAGNGIDDDGNGFNDDVHGWNFLKQGPQVYDGASDAHGTQVAGTIGAVGDNGQGVVGINWAVTMIPAKILGQRGLGSTKNAAKAVDYLTTDEHRLTRMREAVRAYDLEISSATR